MRISDWSSDVCSSDLIVAMHVSGAPESDGMHWWTNLRGDFQRYGSGDDYDGVIPAIAGGVDWSSGNVVFGGFAGYGRGRIDFGRSGAAFRQSEATLAASAGWSGDDGLWVNGQLSWSKPDFNLRRKPHPDPAVP